MSGNASGTDFDVLPHSWMVGLSPDAANFFKYLLILVLYSIAMTLFNFLLAALVSEVGVAILISAVYALIPLYLTVSEHAHSISPPASIYSKWLSLDSSSTCLEFPPSFVGFNGSLPSNTPSKLSPSTKSVVG